MEQPMYEEGTPRGVLIRDFLIFQLKVMVDGLKDAVVFPLAIFVVLVDLVFGSPSRRGRAFYSLMAACESFDQWLNLHGAAKSASIGREGLFGASEPGDGTMVGELEELMRRSDPPVQPAQRIGG